MGPFWKLIENAKKKNGYYLNIYLKRESKNVFYLQIDLKSESKNAIFFKFIEKVTVKIVVANKAFLSWNFANARTPKVCEIFCGPQKAANFCHTGPLWHKYVDQTHVWLTILIK